MSTAGMFYVLVAVVLVVTGQTLLKQGMNLVGPIGRAQLRAPVALTREILRHWHIWVGLGLYAVSAAAWIIALSIVPLSLAYPFLGLTYVFIAFTAVIRLGERLTPAQWLGIALVAGGVLLVAVSG